MITLSVDDQPEVTMLMKRMLTNIDPTGKHMTALSMQEAFSLLNDEVQILFLDIEMPGLNGIEGADILQDKYKNLNVIFVTGHPEYSFQSFSVHPSGFLAKPVDERDILRELKHLRVPLKSLLRVQCHPFQVLSGSEPLSFKRGRTIELFAYMVQRQGAFCTNGELLGMLWDGDPDKAGHLRQLVMDLRDTLNDVGAGHIIQKQYGRIGLNMDLLQIEGDIGMIQDNFDWN